MAEQSSGSSRVPAGRAAMSRAYRLLLPLRPGLPDVDALQDPEAGGDADQ